MVKPGQSLSNIKPSLYAVPNPYTTPENQKPPEQTINTAVGNITNIPPTSNTDNWQPSFTLPPVKFGDYTLNLRNLGQFMKQNEAVTGTKMTDQARAGLYGAGLEVGGMQASEAVKQRKEQVAQGKQLEVQTRMVQLQKESLDKQEENQKGGGGCCFIFIEAYEGLLPIVRRYRDEHMNDTNRRGYYRIADRIVPWMRKSKTVKWIVRILMTGPMVSYGKYFYGQGRVGVYFKPIAKGWLKVFELLGKKPYIRSNGEVI
jgi:hypothetical protein